MNAPIPNIDLIPAGKAFGVPAGARDMMGTTKSASRSPRKRVEHGANHATAQYSDTLDLYHHRSLSVGGGVPRSVGLTGSKRARRQASCSAGDSKATNPPKAA
jgi:hypothetical protein